ncbi:hypothetical protein INR77_02150 [Erythrobacter sp. SCSIO 43205]|uniref:tetratricopeptide repeat protein n=1 Tax=Erythrobacter sp. SCSIO 43205 TaxID=2779361 RepID=UPI001CA9CA45|nr:tetratricopeptide repeat protein [Erythrobacter sp. SCSIO 43205]UAB78560.1 hypothetical protein INR77_02150 [Erythrobacter sp. SCSIO 43205]
MDLISPILLSLALQVGPNPHIGNDLGPPDELVNRPERNPRDNPLERGIEDNPDTVWLAKCLAFLPEQAARAHTLSQVRRNETSGRQRILANHCLGLASTELGMWGDAREAFAAARDETPDDEPSAKARFGAMAGNAAVADSDYESALHILTTAKLHAEASASAPMQAIVASDLARVLVTLERPEEALSELDLATQLMPEDPNNWLLKATLLRRLERLDEAQAAIERASAIAPQDAAIGLEAGVIAVLSGRDDAARQSWQSVIDTAPSAPEALTAQDYLAQLEPS